MWLYRIFFLFLVFQNGIADSPDNEFAEFEDFGDDNSVILNAAIGEEIDSGIVDSNEFTSSDTSESLANDEESDEVGFICFNFYIATKLGNCL